MNTRAKGNQWEKEVKSILEDQGWAVERCNPKLMYIAPGKTITKSHDFFGCWDLIGKKWQERTYWIQVSDWHNASAKRKQVEGFPWNSDYDLTAIWCRMPGKKEFRVLYGYADYEWKGAVERF